MTRGPFLPFNNLMGSRVTADQVRRIVHRHAGLFVRAYLYGSTARGTNDEYSDVELVLVRHTNQSFFDRIREVMPIVRALRRVELLVYTEGELEELTTQRGNFFLQKVVSDGIKIEGKQKRSRTLAPAG